MRPTAIIQLRFWVNQWREIKKPSPEDEGFLTI